MPGKNMKPKKSVLIGNGIIWLLVATSNASAQSVIFVDDDAADWGDGSSWVLAYNKLEDALAMTSPGDKFHVAQGTYIAPSAGFVLKSGIEILGGFAGLGPCDTCDPNDRDQVTFETILTGDTLGDDTSVGNRSDNSFHVLSGFNQSMEIVLDGLTITAGNANGTFTVQQQGGGLSIAACTLTVMNCIFKDNDATLTISLGGGGGAQVSNGDYKFINCLFEDNFSPHGGGLSFVAGTTGSLLLEDCTFTNNTAVIGGGGIEISSLLPNVVIQNCIFKDNSVTLDASTGGAGGGLRGLSNGMLIVNCLFADNFAARCGGAIATTLDSFSSDSDPLIVNCTITGNTTGSSGAGGGICIQPTNGRLTVVNSILWNNADAGGVGESAQIDFSNVISGDVPLVTFCDISGLVPDGDFDADNNISMDPLFVDVLTGDYSLDSLSPAIDEGSNADVPVGILTDLAGNDRILGSAVDMGAFEASGILDPGVTVEILIEILHLTSEKIGDLNVDSFNGPNNNANRGRRKSLANRVRNAANALALGEDEAALALLFSVLRRIDDSAPPKDWMDPSPEKEALQEDIKLLIFFILLIF